MIQRDTKTSQTVMDRYGEKKFPLLVGGGDNYQPLAQDSSGRNFFCGHIGPSMNPTLTARDLLEIAPYNSGRQPRVGDVILFQVPQFDCLVVHRIIRISARGIQTRGDNCRDTDSWYLGNENIYGRVIGAASGNRQRKIAAGLLGRLTGKYYHLRRLGMTRIVNLLRPTYRALCTEGSLHRLIPVRLRPRLVTFKTDKHQSHKLLLGGKVIGAYDQDLHQWQIRRPYRILVNESSLPTPR